MSKYPCGLSKFARFSGSPIALIVNGEPTLSPFIFIIAPPHCIDVVETTLWSFIDIASAPVFFNSFIILSTSMSCNSKSLGFNTVVGSNLLSLSVITVSYTHLTLPTT